MNFSFAGCGFLGIYHVGVSACLKKYAPNLLVDKISGASAGALAAACLLCDCDLGLITSAVLKTVTEARTRLLGPFSPTFNVDRLLREGLLGILPDDAHERVSGKLFVSVTRITDGKNVLLSEFTTMEELVQALLASSFVPFFSGFIPFLIDGTFYVDGGFSNNQPVIDSQTVTVSPFAGSADICPRDDAELPLQINLANTSIELSPQNLYRFARILFPPPPEVLSRMCQQGFDDALEFLQRNKMISCMRCLTVQSVIRKGSGELVVSQQRDLIEDGVLVALQDHQDACLDCQRQRLQADLDILPEQVGRLLQTAINSANKGIMNWVFKHKSMKVVSVLTLPYVVPFDLLCSLTRKLLYDAPSLADVSKFFSDVTRLALLVGRALVSSDEDRLMKLLQRERRPPEHEHHHRPLKEDQQFSCKMDILEFVADGKDVVDSDSLSVGRSTVTDYYNTLDNLQQVTRSVSRNPSRLPSRAVSRAVSRMASTVDLTSLEDAEPCGLSRLSDDTIDHIYDVTKHQEAIMTYYYGISKDEFKVMEYYDISGPQFDEITASDTEDLTDEMSRDKLESVLTSQFLSIEGSDEKRPLSSCDADAESSCSEPEADQPRMQMQACRY